MYLPQVFSVAVVGLIITCFYHADAASVVGQDVRMGRQNASEPEVAGDLHDLRELVQHLESRVCQLSDRVDSLERKNQDGGPAPSPLLDLDKKLPSAMMSDIRGNISDLAASIEQRFSRLLDTLSALSVTSHRTSVCTWNIGTPSSDNYQGQPAFTAATGSGTLKCYPDEEGWLTLLRRVDGSVEFGRTWEEYKYSFGDPDGNFWLGNEIIHLLTHHRRYKLRVDLTDWSGEKKYATYNYFKIGSELEKYKLSVLGYNGTAGDSLTYHNDNKFSTLDQDNDRNNNSNCASHVGGAGWWFNACDNACLTGMYFTGGMVTEAGIEWTTAYKDARSFKRAEMKIKPL